MDSFTFCPNSFCELHLRAPASPWYDSIGWYDTGAFGRVPRFRCRCCRKTFSAQTFSIDYYAKRIVDYEKLLLHHSSSESVRALGRSFGVSCGTIQNRIDRLARQGAALHARLRKLARPAENVCVDGFVSFDRSQFFPNEITLSITSVSRFALELSHATKRRSGTMTAGQKERAGCLYPRVCFERAAVTRSFRDILDSLLKERPPERTRPLVVITDEKKEYGQALRAHPLWKTQDGEHRTVHVTVNSKIPRTFSNPLFPSNYLDREIRKDQANHHRESTCFTRNVSNGMSRLLCYLVQHNYRKRYSIKARAGEDRVHAEVAGIGREVIERGLSAMFREREFLTRLVLPPTLEKIWRKDFPTPLTDRKDCLPRFALG